MTEQARAARREYLREWRQKHPDKVKEHAARYWERRAQQMEEKNHDDI